MANYFDITKVGALYPGAAMIPAMKIWTLPKNKKNMLEEICNNGEYFAQLKKDGCFYSLNIAENATYLFSRSEGVDGLLTNKSANVPHVCSAFQELPKNTVIIGEIYVPGGTSKAVTHMIGGLPATAIKNQEKEGLVHYYIHDILIYNGINLMNTDALVRYKILEKLCEKHDLLKFDYIELATNVYENINEVITEALNSGEEGMVLKRKDGKYFPDKRPAWNSIKVKQVDYADVIITGFCDATKEYSGKEIDTWQYWIIEQQNELGWHFLEKCPVGQKSAIKGINYRTIAVTKPYYMGWKTAMKVSAYDTKGELVEIGTISSGLNDELRAGFAFEPDKYLGKVVAVQCMSLDRKEQTIRHGFLKEFRDDKNARDCTLETVFS